jgi:hypothetical protein
VRVRGASHVRVRGAVHVRVRGASHVRVRGAVALVAGNLRVAVVGAGTVVVMIVMIVMILGVAVAVGVGVAVVVALVIGLVLRAATFFRFFLEVDGHVYMLHVGLPAFSHRLRRTLNDDLRLRVLVYRVVEYGLILVVYDSFLLDFDEFLVRSGLNS